MNTYMYSWYMAEVVVSKKQQDTIEHQSANGDEVSNIILHITGERHWNNTHESNTKC